MTVYNVYNEKSIFDDVVNLPKLFSLSSQQGRLVSRGLSFIPTPDGERVESTVMRNS